MAGRFVFAAVSAAALIGFGATGQEAGTQVLTGAEAFGNWEQDAPGVTRLIRAEDLAAPNSEESTSNGPGTVERPEGATPLVPDGFKAELVALGIENPRVLRFAPNGDLFLANSGFDEIRVYRFAGDGATPVEEGVFASEGLNQPYGIAFHPAGDDPQWVYIANSDGIVRFPYRAGDIRARGAPETIVSDIPDGGHWTRDLVFSADGKTMYLSVGSEGNAGEDMGAPSEGWQAWAAQRPLGAAFGPEERRANLLAFDPDGSNERVFATGLRNCAGMSVQQATGQVWCAVNERDALGDNVPFEYATSVQEGAFYGWPWYYIGGNEDPRLAGARPDLADQVTVPDVLFQAHSAPLGITFFENDAFGADIRGDAFVAMHGSWNRNTRTGYKIVRLDFDENGAPTGTYQDFVTGFVLSDDEVWGRPVGVAVSPGGALFFSEDGSGTIWKVSAE